MQNSDVSLHSLITRLSCAAIEGNVVATKDRRLVVANDAVFARRGSDYKTGHKADIAFLALRSGKVCN